MRGFYALYGDEVYELCEQDFRPREIANMQEETHLETSVLANERRMKISITLTDVDKSDPSNREMFKIVRDYLVKNRTTQLLRLAPIYRVYMEYRLEDKNLDTVVDEGICVKEMRANAVEIPLGLTDENEYVGRVGLTMGAQILKSYQSRIPYGMRMVERNEFYLVITRIYVAQVIMPALSIAPVVGCRPNCIPPLPPMSLGIPNTPYNSFRPMPPEKRRKFEKDYMLYAGSHPSMGQVTELSTLNSDAVIIFDSVVAGLQFNPICINFKPDTIEINLKFMFNDVLMTGTRDDINMILEENKRVDDTTDKPVVDYPEILPPCDPNWPPKHDRPHHGHYRPKPPASDEKNKGCTNCTCSQTGTQKVVNSVVNPLKPSEEASNNNTKWI